MRAVRWILGIAAALVLILALAVLVITTLVNPDAYRGQAQRLVSRYTGRPFVIEGHLHLMWFPWLGVRVGPARLGNLPGESGADLIEWRSAQVSVRLLPLLLHHRVQLGPIRLDGLDIHLWRAPDGRANWQDLLIHRGAASVPSSAGAPPVLGGLIVNDGSLHYADGKTRVDLTHWRLRVSAWQDGRPLSVSTRFVVRGGALPASGLAVRFEAVGVRVQREPLAVSTPRFSLRVATVSLSGAAQVAHTGGGFQGAGTLALSVPSVRGLIGLLGLHPRLPADPSALGALSLSTHWRVDRGAIALEPLETRLDATTLTGSVERSGAAHAPWTFALSADHIDFGRYLPPARKRPKPLTLPVKFLRGLAVHGTLNVVRATYEGTVMQNLQLQVQ